MSQQSDLQISDELIEAMSTTDPAAQKIYCDLMQNIIEAVRRGELQIQSYDQTHLMYDATVKGEHWYNVTHSGASVLMVTFVNHARARQNAKDFAAKAAKATTA